MQMFHSAAAMVPASIPSPDWSGFDIPLPWGSLRIHAYALCILAGIIVGLWLTSRRWAKRGAPEGSVWDIVIWAIPFGIIGGRLYHVVSSPDAYFGPGFDGTGDLSLIPQIQRGGLGIWGAVVLGVFGAWIGCRRAGVKLPAFLDAAAPGLLLAQAVGRWGNYFNQELFGGPTTLPWGLQVDADNPNFPSGFAADTLFHPTFLYESLWNLAGVLILLALDRRFHFRRGRLFWLYAMYYTLGRVWIEAMRIDDAEQISLFGITTRLNVWTSIFVFVAALAVFIVLGQGKKRDADSIYLPGREPAAESAGIEAAVDTVGDKAAVDTVANKVAVEPGGHKAAEPAGNKTAVDTPANEAAVEPAGNETAVETAAGVEKTDDVGPSPKSASGRRSAVDPVRDPDPAVSDSESRGNLPDNQNGPGRSSAPTEAVPAPSGDNTSATDSPDTGKSGAAATGTAPKADGTR
ncbi:prolipoprotein diacylglyceryl transferase [Arthrobacter sp. ISL-28]|uniref:prolipoprotein diacylglyceryl transferase n=1 Tax=Arthrobacter sp. ISL-28 TaxID=2819108 RepID=UPI001BE9B4F9|nr:prolipoprotein diacylglyceryl transferase [Arthrobacter sp. ISL-28]MBT2521802.1 prolipoprotein diacylglyceryl transferase [Arthrobacter sp. ISL-28]